MNQIMSKFHQGATAKSSAALLNYKNQAQDISCHFQPTAEPYVCSDRLKTPVLRRCVLAPYVPLRFYPSESASEQTYGSAVGVTRRKTNHGIWKNQSRSLQCYKIAVVQTTLIIQGKLPA